jgi:hypothetical protein
VRDDRDFQERVLSEAQVLVERSMPGLLAKRGVWPEETYRKILDCLHPDRSVSDAWLNEAFNAFTEAKLLLVKPKEQPPSVRRGLREHTLLWRQGKHAEAATGTAAQLRDDRDFQERVLSKAQALVEQSMPGLLAKRGVWPAETYRKILDCLHPDRAARDAWLNEAFRAFAEAKLLLVKPKEQPPSVGRGLRRRSGPQQ